MRQSFLTWLVSNNVKPLMMSSLSHAATVTIFRSKEVVLSLQLSIHHKMPLSLK